TTITIWCCDWRSSSRRSRRAFRAPICRVRSSSTDTRLSWPMASATTGAGSIAARLAIGPLATLALRFGHWHLRVDPRIAAEIIERSEWLYRRTNDAVAQRPRAEPRLAGMAAALTGI